MDKKYIIIDRKHPVLFSSSIEHKDENNKRNATSAGFYKFYIDNNGEIQVECWGESNSLGGLKSKPVLDALIIKKMLIEF